ncbi:MAG: hypothetical protein ACT4P3_07915 [Betaproteobacteria bacterium]
MHELLPTTVVGSYPQPHWLIDRELLGGKVPRVRAPEVWRVAAEFLEQAQDDATLLAIRDMERTGIDIITMAQQAQDDYYRDEEAVAMAFAAAVNAEIRELKAAGADVIQLDEPWLQARHERAARYGVKAINRAFLPQLADTRATQISIEAAQPQLDLGVLRDLAPKAVMLGVLDLGDPRVERAALVAERIRAGLAHVAAERLVAAPDCGMKYLPREVAFGKLQALAEGAALVRRRL